MNDRSQVLARLKQDIVGPRSGFFESIPEKPSSRYLTGILFPQGSSIGQEEDDEIDQTESKDDGTSGIEDKVSLFASMRPSTAGFSFAVKAIDTDAKVLIGATFARYSLIEQQPSETSNHQAPDVSADPNTPPQGKNVAKVKRRFWQRTPVKLRFEIPLKAGDSTRLAPDSELECVWKIRRTGDLFLVTVQFVNTAVEKELTATEREESTLFQFRAAAICQPGANFAPRPRAFNGQDEDQEISDLIYRDVHEYATGHTASVNWRQKSDSPPGVIHLTWIPTAIVKTMNNAGDPIFANFLVQSEGSFSALDLAHRSDDFVSRSILALCDAYDTWIAQQTDIAERIEDNALKDRATKNLLACKKAARRMRDGASRIITNTDSSMRVFRLANWAMYTQFAWKEGSVNGLEHRPGDEYCHNFSWRPFQLAFVLMCLCSSTKDDHDERKTFDLIWFPTGGGKTEAYLFLAAFVLFDRRIRYGKAGGGVGAFMRYTLRTLTIQQFERAASLITACEMIRRTEKGLGETPFSIGLWVGGASTPNNFDEAKKVINDPDATSTPRQITHCPVCQTEEIQWIADDFRSEVYCQCSAENCIGRIPVKTVDSDIYRTPPSLLIGTIDKFAQIVRKPETARLFGLGTEVPFQSPDLIIQDELHLISGPLGSMAGLYELAIDQLCSREGNPPKIVGSTATIRRASDQVRNVFNREAFQFPPPALDWKNSCFARLADGSTEPGRLYVGVTTAGRSEKFALQYVAASLLQSGSIVPGGDDEPYKTLVTYFNSLKTLGGALVLLEDDALMTLKSIAESRNEKIRDNVKTPEELTSRKSSKDIPDILKRLELTSLRPEFIDILLASNMLSVGVDIRRLGLMLLSGQPKSMAEYIQATSRVGRARPGLVITLYNNAKIRDRAHFEAFSNWHGALYRSVEPGSVTPFAARARDKALHAPLVALARLRENISVQKPDEHRLREICTEILNRINGIDSSEVNDARQDLDKFVTDWCDLAAAGQLKEYWQDSRQRISLLMSAEEAAARRAMGNTEMLAHPTPNSLRNVEPGVTFEIKESANTFSEYRGKTTSETGENDS